MKPLKNEAFKKRRSNLYEPLIGYLHNGSTGKFRLRVPGAKKVAVVVGKHWYMLKKQGELFEGDIFIERGNIGVYAQFPWRKHFIGLLQYVGV